MINGWLLLNGTPLCVSVLSEFVSCHTVLKIPRNPASQFLLETAQGLLFGTSAYFRLWPIVRIELSEHIADVGV